MGVINETLKLTDHFSAAFQTFIQMGSRSASTAETLRESTDQYARTSQYAAQQLDALKGVLSSQESLYAAQGQRLDAQRQKVAELAARHAKLAASKGMEAGATTRAAEALARAQIQEQRMLQAALKTSEAMERQNTEILKFTDRMGGASSAVEQTARKQKQHTKEVERTSRASGKLLKATTLIAAAAGAARLAKSFLDFSDTQAPVSYTHLDYAQFLTVLEPYTFDILVYDGTDSATMQAMASFVKRVSENVGLKCQAVMAGAETSNSEWVISVNNGVKLSDGTELSPQQATWWLGGAEAGARYNESLTYARYPDAIEAFPKKKDTEISEAIQKGEVVFIDNFGTVKVCTDINTLTSFSVDKGQEYSKNRVMRVLNQFCNDVYRQFSLYYIGKVDNNETGRGLLKAWIVGYLNEMQANGGIQNFVADDVSVQAGNSVDSVLVDVALQPVDSIEKIYMTVAVSVNAESV